MRAATSRRNMRDAEGVCSKLSLSKFKFSRFFFIPFRDFAIFVYQHIIYFKKYTCNVSWI